MNARRGRSWSKWLLLAPVLFLFWGQADAGAPPDTVRLRPWAIPDSVVVPSRARHYGPPRPGKGADVRVLLSSSVKRDERAGTWTYTYVVKNHRDSPRGVWSFMLVPVPPDVVVLASPKRWLADRSDSLLSWFCTDPGPQPRVDDGNVHPSPFDLQPGASATFRLVSHFAPGDSVRYYIQGFNAWPVIHNYQEEDSILNTTPSFFVDSAHGKVIGPRLSH